MKKTYILVGEDSIRKSVFISNLFGEFSRYNVKKIIANSNSSKDFINIKNESFMFLSTVDMFDCRDKILILYLDNEKQVAEIIEEVYYLLGENILIVDIFSKRAPSTIKKSKIYNENKDSINIQFYESLNERHRDDIIKDMENILDKNKICFENKCVKRECLNYIYDNSNYSYSAIYKFIEQLIILDVKCISSEDIKLFLRTSFNGNYYLLLDNLVKAKNKEDFLNYLQRNIVLFGKSDMIVLSGIFAKFIKDYIRYENGVRCKNGSNYYKIKNMKFNIVDSLSLYIEINDFVDKIKNVDISCSEDFIHIFRKYID